MSAFLGNPVIKQWCIYYSILVANKHWPEKYNHECSLSKSAFYSCHDFDSHSAFAKSFGLDIDVIHLASGIMDRLPDDTIGACSDGFFGTKSQFPVHFLQSIKVGCDTKQAWQRWKNWHLGNAQRMERGDVVCAPYRKEAGEPSDDEDWGALSRSLPLSSRVSGYYTAWETRVSAKSLIDCLIGVWNTR